MYHKFYSYLLIKLLLYQFRLNSLSCESIPDQISSLLFQTEGSNSTTTNTKLYSNCHILFLVIALSSLFIYLFSISISDYLSRDNQPEVYSSKGKNSQILSKYLVKLIFGKWSSNIEFNNTFLNIEFNTHDSKLTSSSFVIPMLWLRKFMDHVGTIDNPDLKSIKFWVHQPDSLGLISSVKLSIKDSRNTNIYIYLDSIEMSRISDDKIQVINIQKNVRFFNYNQQSLNIRLAFRNNTKAKVLAYDGYKPYFAFPDYFYFYVIYLNLSFLILNYASFDWIFDTKLDVQNINFNQMIIDCLIKTSLCTILIFLIAIFYLCCIKSNLSRRHNSQMLRSINIIFLSSLFVFIFLLNYFICVEPADLYQTRRLIFLYELVIIQLLFVITLLCLFILSRIFKSRTLKNMSFKAVELESVKSLKSAENKPDNFSAKVKSTSSSSVVIKRVSTDSRSSQPKSGKIFKQVTVLVKNAAKEEHPLRRIDSDNSIGSGYYNQMITATKHVRSISQYGELLKDKN